MYKDFFNFNTLPFSIAPNPDYLFMSPRHQEALAHLSYGVIEGGGFVALSGEVGTGKTTLCYRLVQQLPDFVDIALILNPRQDPVEILANLCDELRVDYPADNISLKILVDRLNHHLLEVHAQGRKTVVLIDEAQNLSFEVLEQLRLLTNLETAHDKLLQIILVGQSELNSILEKPELRQLKQRITAHYHLSPFSFPETSEYIKHRLKISGCAFTIFSPNAVKSIHKASRGIPRLINTICDRALLGAYTQGKHKVSSSIAKKAADEIINLTPTQPNYLKWAGVFGLTLLTLGLASMGFQKMQTKEPENLSTSILTKTPNSSKSSISKFKPPSTNNKTQDPNVTAKPKSKPEKTSKKTNNDEAAVVVKPRIDSVQKKVSTIKSSISNPIPLKDIETLTMHLNKSGQRLSNAFNHLFAAWNIANMGDNLLLTHMVSKGTWEELLKLNRPAILELHPITKLKRYLTLIKVDSINKTAVVNLENQYYVLKLRELMQFWEGHFIIIWQSPSKDRKILQKPYRGPELFWLRERFDALGQTTFPDMDSDVFDKTLKQSVILFQQKYGLKEDGVVGPKTIIELNNQTDTPRIPKLAVN